VPFTMQADPSQAAPGDLVTVTLTYEVTDTDTDKSHAVKWTWNPQNTLSISPDANGIQTDGAFFTLSRPATSTSLGFTAQYGPTGPSVRIHAQVVPVASTTRIKDVPDRVFRNPDAGESQFVSLDIVVDEPRVEVSMRRAAVDPTPSQALWTLIRQTTNALSFLNYQAFMEVFLCHPDPTASDQNAVRRSEHHLHWRLPFPGVEPYRQLKAATETFVMLNCGVMFDKFMKNPSRPFISPTQQWNMDAVKIPNEIAAEGRRYSRQISPGDIAEAWNRLLTEGATADAAQEEQSPLRTILYLALVRANLPDAQITQSVLGVTPQAALELDRGAIDCIAILREKLTNPCFLELLWSYWHEEGGLVQTMNAITWRFQNRRGPRDQDPLASLEIDPLRPLNNFIWGYIQDEEHRLTVMRRAYEYAHHYGLTLIGKAVPAVRGADNRSRFIEAFHNLMHLCSVFYKEDDDTTVVADGFPLLNGLKEVHLLLTQGASNQYGDLPWTARQEMLMQQWLLARPEFREYLPRRVMVDYPETWMHAVETMKGLQGWTSVSVLHFRDLAVFGEQVVLSIRFEAWPSIIESQNAANWARYWRPEIQGYIYAYRAATSVDLTERPDATPPAMLLRQRMQEESIPAAGRAALTAPSPVVQVPTPSRLSDRTRR
jgi:hypothetical protein